MTSPSEHIGLSEHIGPSEHIKKVSRVYSDIYWQLWATLDESLDPRGPDQLHEIASEYVGPGTRILDVGCRDAGHLIRLVRAHDASGVGVDPVAWHVERAKAAVAEAGLGSRIEIVTGVMQDLPFLDENFDFVWCRDVLEHVDELDAGLREANRVLKLDGAMLVHTNYATERLDDREAAMIGPPMAGVRANLDRERVEAAFSEVGFVIERTTVIGTEWREYLEERDALMSRDMLRLARLRRRRDEIVARFGEEVYDTAQASLHWQVYEFLGKVVPVLYVLRPAAP